MVKQTFRTRTIATKVSAEEYALFAASAGDQSMAEWMRETLLRAARATTPAAEGPKATPAEEVLMAEILAMRTIFVNALFKLSNGEAISEADMRQLIERADLTKQKKAVERLQAK